MKKITRKSQVGPIFGQWLAFMEEAYEALTREEFRQLEDKILAEVNFHRSSIVTGRGHQKRKK